MTTKTSAASTIDMEKYRLRSFVERLIDMGEVEIHDQLVPLAGLGAVIEGTQKAVLFKKTGPEHAEMVAKTVGNRRRLAAAFQTSEDKLYEEYFKRLANPQTVMEVPSKDAPVHELAITGNNVDLTKLPFHPQHAYDGSCHMTSAIDYAVDPLTGRRNAGCRRLSLRNRYEAGTNVTAPSDIKRVYQACIARGERLAITFAVGAHPLDFFAATTRQGGDELSLIATFRGETAPVVKSLTNDILVPADAELTLEGYLDERGYAEPEGPYGEYMAHRAKAGFDCTKPFGRAGEIPLTRSAAKVFGAPARFQTVEQALASGPLFYAEIVEALGSDDGREVACALDALRQRGRLARDRDGHYYLGQFKPGHTGIVGELYHDPNEGT